MGEAAILTRCETTVCARLTQGRLFDLWSKASLMSDCASSEFGKKEKSSDFSLKTLVILCLMRLNFLPVSYLIHATPPLELK